MLFEKRLAVLLNLRQLFVLLFVSLLALLPLLSHNSERFIQLPLLSLEEFAAFFLFFGLLLCHDLSLFFLTLLLLLYAPTLLTFYFLLHFVMVFLLPFPLPPEPASFPPLAEPSVQLPSLVSFGIFANFIFSWSARYLILASRSCCSFLSYSCFSMRSTWARLINLTVGGLGGEGRGRSFADAGGALRSIGNMYFDFNLSSLVPRPLAILFFTLVWATTSDCGSMKWIPKLSDTISSRISRAVEVLSGIPRCSGMTYLKVISFSVAFT